MKKSTLITIVLLGIFVTGVGQTKNTNPHPIRTTITYPSEELTQRPENKSEYYKTITLPILSESVYKNAAIMVYIKSPNTQENFQAIPFESIANTRRYVYSYGVGTLTIVSNEKDNISIKIVMVN